MADVFPGAQPQPASLVRQTPDEILVAFAGPAPQHRGTVLVRVFMAIPHLIVLYALNIAAEVVAVICWFALLFTGRRPESLAEFLAGWLRWSARVYSYLWLLTDRYPPFELADPDYPVRVSVAPGPLNRLAVFFRFILAIPAALLLGLLFWGTGTLVAFVAWIIVLIRGSLPEPLYLAFAAVLRYAVRYYGYFYLLSGTYPAGLFGDPPGQDAAAAGEAGTIPPTEGGTAAGGGTPPEGATTTGDETAAEGAPPAGDETAAEGGTAAGGIPPAGGREAGPGAPPPAAPWGPPAEQPPGQPPPGYGQPGAYPAPAGGLLAPEPHAWRLVLPDTAKRLVGLFIALGVILLAGYITLIVVLSVNASNPANARATIQSAHTRLSRALSAYQAGVQACGQNVSCVTRQDKKAAQAFGSFGQSVDSTSVPSGDASAARARLLTDTSKIESDLNRLATAKSAVQYQEIVGSTGLQNTVNDFSVAYDRLGAALHQS